MKQSRNSNKLGRLKMRNEDAAYYENTCRHTIEAAMADHPEWGRDGKYAGTPGGIRRIINLIGKFNFPFKLEGATPAARYAWSRALKSLKNEMMQNLERDGGIKSEKDDIDRKEPVALTDPEEIKRFMDARGISLNEAAKRGGVTMATVISFRKKVKIKLKKEGKKFLAYLESMGYKPGFKIKEIPLKEKSQVDASLKILFNALADKCDEIGESVKEFGDIFRRLKDG